MGPVDKVEDSDIYLQAGLEGLLRGHRGPGSGKWENQRTRAGEAALRPSQRQRLQMRGVLSALTIIEPDAIAEEVSALGEWRG